MVLKTFHDCQLITLGFATTSFAAIEERSFDQNAIEVGGQSNNVRTAAYGHGRRLFTISRDNREARLGSISPYTP